MRQLTALDAQFLAMETPRTYGHVGGFAVHDPSSAPGGKITRADVCRLIGERIHMLPPFRWKLVQVPLGLDHPYWIEDADFDLDFHVRETAVPPPGGARQLGDQIARIFARPLDRSRPLWELYLVHGLEGGKIGFLTKIHHAAVDGMSGAEIMSILLDLEAEGREVPPPDADYGEPVPGQLEMLGRGVVGMWNQPLRAVRGLPGVLPGLDEVPTLRSLPGVGLLGRTVFRAQQRVARGSHDGGMLERAPVRAPRTRFNGRISPHRRFAFGSLSLDKVKAIKNELGITVNDVVMALCATALREWLIERDELPRDPLVAMVPVSVRSEEERGTYGNRVSTMVVPIPTDEPDPRVRLMKMHDLMRVAKDRHSALPANLMQDATQFIPPALLSRAARVIAELSEVGRPPLNLVISNVPGPQRPLYMAGTELVANYPVSVIMDGVGLNITVLSYRGHLDFGIIADREQIDDAWPLMRKLGEGLDEIEDVICGSGKVSSPVTHSVPVAQGSA
ncbi:MAG: wax ester/triacylglycerol synthase family O-acyltransferase [Actinomycetota bacterium]|nr:wax ester/triacylglycerol synthase family O-acyltransferase [Actinomycetota bacterium]